MIDEAKLRAFVTQYLERLYLAGTDDADVLVAQYWLNDCFRKAYDAGLLHCSIEPTLPEEMRPLQKSSERMVDDQAIDRSPLDN